MKSINFNKLDGLIWDMDGVLIDVSRSYRRVVLKTAQYFCQKKVSMQDVAKIKQVVGLNNDWDASFALILFKNEDLKPELFVKKFSFYRKEKQYQRVVQLFQSYYLGKKLYLKCYQFRPFVIKEPGFISSEKLLITKNTLQKLQSKYKKMAIVTGRPKFEAEYALKTNNISSLFDMVVALESTKRGKPYPDPLLLAMQKTGLKKTLYIGDSPSDIVAAKKAKIPSIYLGVEKLGTIKAENINQLLGFLL